MNKRIFYLGASIVILILASIWFIAKRFETEKINEFSQSQDQISNVEDAGDINSESEKKFIGEEKVCLIAPLDDYEERITKKPFGIYITPSNSPVKPERFSGYHVGTDFEIFSTEDSSTVEVKAVCDGNVLVKKYASGYGGVLVESCFEKGKDTTIIYGHLSLSSITKNVGDKLAAGEVIGNLGDPQKGETDGERKHLHLAIHLGTEINILGYVNEKENLSSWIDPTTLFCLN